MIEYTDQQFLYRAVPVDYDGAAKLKRIKGNTLAFNQLARYTNHANATVCGLTITNNNNGSFKINGTYNASGDRNMYGYISIINAIQGHKYLVKSTGSLMAAFVYGSASGNRDATEYIVTASSSGNMETAIRLIDSKANNGQVVNETIWVNIFDLTLMGIDTIEQFESLFPLSYYSYQSTLLPFKGTGIKTVGKNIFSTQGNTWYKNNASEWNSTIDSNPIRIRSMGFPCKKGTYTVSGFPTSNNISLALVRCYDINHNNLGDATRNGNTFVISFDECEYISLLFGGTNFDSSTNALFKNADIQVELGSTATEYEPYTETTTSLPISTYFPTGMKSAGNVYDELTPNKASERVGSMTLDGSQSASVSIVGSYTRLSVVHGASNVKYPNAQQESNYLPYLVSFAEESNHFYANDSQAILIMQSSVVGTTVDSFNSYLQSHPLTIYYELATETETDAEDIFYKFYADGTEQILPVNGAIPTTAPIWCDIEYYNQIESETPYRKFWLVNGNGERWDLTEKELKSFLENPQGLGFQKTIDVTRYGERAYKNTESYNFPQVTGDVLFYDSANSTRYEKYNEFVRFLMEQPITLHYMIPVSYNSLIADTYSLECEVMSLTKTESKTDRILTSNIQMNGLGFYEGDEIEINGTANTLTISNKGDFPVGFEIELNGDFKNPYFTLEQNGELYGEAKFDDNANNFSSVFVNSKDGEQNVVLKQNNSIMPNPLAYQDLSISNGSIYVTFVKLAKGESTLTIGGDSYTISGYTIRYTPIYRSV